MISNDNNDGAARAASIEGERQQVLRLLDWLEEGAGLAIVAITVFKARPQPQPFGSTERLAAFMEANIDKMMAVTPEVKVPIEGMPASVVRSTLSHWLSHTTVNVLWQVDFVLKNR